MVVVSASGEFGFQTGGIRENRNHLNTHIATLAHLLGVARDRVHLIEVEYQEFGDGRFSCSLAAAEKRVGLVVRQLASELGQTLSPTAQAG